MIIKHKNILYMPNISPLGGIETYVYEMVKKYKDLDIAVVSKKCDKLQARRIKKYCPLYIHTDQKIECDVAIINYDVSIIDYINEGAKIYQTIHGDYSNPIYGGKKPPKHPRLTGYIAITKYLQKKIKELYETENVIMSYNPLTIEPSKPYLTFVTASRLHKNKGIERMKQFIRALDRAKIDYIWYCITNDTDVIKHPNIIFIQNRLDVDKWINLADYGILLSDSEADSYFIKEILYRNKPIITTPLPYLKEIGVEDGKNGYIIDFDCSNVDEVANKVEKIPKFIFKQLEDDYRNIFVKSKSKYKEELDMKYRVQAILNFYDMEDKEDKYKELPEKNKDGSPVRESQHIWIVDKERADYLLEHNAIKILEEIKPIEYTKDKEAKSVKIKAVKREPEVVEITSPFDNQKVFIADTITDKAEIKAVKPKKTNRKKAK